MTHRVISRSQNISLYPTLSLGMNGEFVCAWYEYSSPDMPARSDVWCSLSKNGVNWTEPVNVSGQDSYNNGPSVLSCRKDYYLLAWHSWRKPGKAPFTPDGDICNIFIAQSTDCRSWSEPMMVLQRLSNTEYPAMVRGPDGLLRLFFAHRDSKKLYVSKIKDGVQSGEPEELAGLTSEVRYPDVAVGPDKSLYLAFVMEQEKESLWLTASEDWATWSPPQPISPSDNVRLTRPKISVDEKGKVWVTCHSDAWGSYTVRYGLRLSTPRLELEVSSNKTPGNSCWTLNAVEVVYKRTGAVKLFTFGPDMFSFASPVVKVTEQHCLYTPEKMYGFDRPLHSMLREIGNNITRTLFYGEEPRKFLIDLAEGEYEIKITYCSWIASTPGTLFHLNGDILYVEQPHVTPDSVFMSCLEKGKCIFTKRVNPDIDFDNNRPSKIVHADNNKKHVAWSRYGPKSIDIVLRSFHGL